MYGSSHIWVRCLHTSRCHASRKLYPKGSRFLARGEGRWHKDVDEDGESRFNIDGTIKKKIEPPPITNDRFHLTDSWKMPYDMINPHEVMEKQVYPDYEESREDFKHVLALLPFLYVPEPKNEPSSTGWRPPAAKRPDLPYFIRRTKSHMLPVYVHERDNGTRRFTSVSQVEGDVWALEEDLKSYLKELTGNPDVVSRVNEPFGSILYKGIYVNAIREWLHTKGF